MKNKINFIAAILLILFAVLSRLIPHPPNFAPIAGIALFAGVYLNKRYTFVIPLIAMLISDYFIGFHAGMIWIYGSFAVIACIGLWLKEHKRPLYIAGAAVTSSVLFFMITNFGVWAGGSYGYTYEGLVKCYVMAIPFFHNTLMGDAFYVTGMFLLYEALYYFINKSGQAEIKNNY